MELTLNSCIDQVKELQTNYNNIVLEQTYHYSQSLILYSQIPSQSEHILDLGCGTGYFTCFLSQKFNNVIGVDISEEFIAKAREKFNNLKFIVQDMHNLNFSNNTFDVICADNVLEHSYDPAKVLSELNRVLKLNGFLFILIPPDKRNLKYNSWGHWWKTDTEELRTVLTLSGFNILEYKEYDTKKDFGYLYMPSDNKVIFIKAVKVKDSYIELPELKKECEANKLNSLKTNEFQAWQYFQQGLDSLNNNFILQAIELFNCALKLNPFFKNIYYYLGIAYEKILNFDKAKEYYLYLLENLNRDHSLARIKLINLFIKCNDIPKALEHFEALEQYNPDILFINNIDIDYNTLLQSLIDNVTNINDNLLNILKTKINTPDIQYYQGLINLVYKKDIFLSNCQLHKAYIQYKNYSEAQNYLTLTLILNKFYAITLNNLEGSQRYIEQYINSKYFKENTDLPEHRAILFFNDLFNKEINFIEYTDNLKNKLALYKQNKAKYIETLILLEKIYSEVIKDSKQSKKFLKEYLKYHNSNIVYNFYKLIQNIEFNLLAKTELKIDTAVKDFYSDPVNWSTIRTNWNNIVNCDLKLINIAGGIKNKTVLNIGCYYPDLELAIARQSKEWISIDYCDTVIDKAKKVIKDNQLDNIVKCIVADARDLPFENNYFDMVLLLHTLDHIPEGREKVIKEVYRVLKHNGIAIIVVPNLKFPGFVQENLEYGYWKSFTREEIEDLLEQNNLKSTFFLTNTNTYNGQRMGFIVFKTDFINEPINLLNVHYNSGNYSYVLKEANKLEQRNHKVEKLINDCIDKLGVKLHLC